MRQANLVLDDMESAIKDMEEFLDKHGDDALDTLETMPEERLALGKRLADAGNEYLSLSDVGVFDEKRFESLNKRSQGILNVCLNIITERSLSEGK